MATKKKITLKRKTAKKAPLTKKKKTFVDAEVKKVKNDKGRTISRVHTQTYKEGRSGQYVPVGPAVAANAKYNKDGTITEKPVSIIKSRGTTTTTTTPTANPKIRAANKKKKAAENKTPISRRKTVAKKKKKTTVKKKKK